MTTRVTVAATLLLAAVLTSACSMQVRIAGTPQPAPGASPSTAAPASSAGDPSQFPTVLSTTTADSGRTVTSTELTGELVAAQAQRPAGYRGLAVVVRSGLGSFDTAVPQGYTAVWRAGTPPDDVLAEAARRDPAWANGLRSTLTNAKPDGGLRAVAVDTAPPDDGVRALFVTLGPASEETGDALAARMRSDFDGKSTSRVIAARGVTVNGAAGAYAEFTIDRPGMAPRVGIQVRIPDSPNHLLWGVTCESPAAERAALAQTCATIAGRFRPLPTISG